MMRNVYETFLEAELKYTGYFFLFIQDIYVFSQVHHLYENVI